MNEINKMLDYIQGEEVALSKAQLYELVSQTSLNTHIKPSYDRELYHRVNGAWSGIPLCCVDYFIELENNHVPAALFTKYYRGQSNAETAGYVVCPACYMENNTVKVKHNGVVAGFLLEGVNR